MNPVLQFAIDNQGQAKRLLAGVYNIPRDDLDDCGQEVLLRILRAVPRADCPRAYWSVTVRSAAYSWHRRQPHRIVHYDESIDSEWLADPSQDPVTTQETREEIAAAFAQATAAEREALMRLLTRPGPLLGRDVVCLHRFRRRLRGVAA